MEININKHIPSIYSILTFILILPSLHILIPWILWFISFIHHVFFINDYSLEDYHVLFLFNSSISKLYDSFNTTVWWFIRWVLVVVSYQLCISSLLSICKGIYDDVVMSLFNKCKLHRIWIDFFYWSVLFIMFHSVILNYFYVIAY